MVYVYLLCDFYLQFNAELRTGRSTSIPNVIAVDCDCFTAHAFDFCYRTALTLRLGYGHLLPLYGGLTSLLFFLQGYFFVFIAKLRLESSPRKWVLFGLLHKKNERLYAVLRLK